MTFSDEILWNNTFRRCISIYCSRVLFSEWGQLQPVPLTDKIVFLFYFSYHSFACSKGTTCVMYSDGKHWMYTIISSLVQFRNHRYNAHICQTCWLPVLFCVKAKFWRQSQTCPFSILPRVGRTREQVAYKPHPGLFPSQLCWSHRQLGGIIFSRSS